VLKKSLLLSFSLLATTSLGYAADDAKIGTMTAPDQMEWRELAPGSPVKLTILWGDRSKGEYAMLIKLPAGFAAPIHAHTGDYHGINLSGTWRHSFDGGEERDLSPGSYVFQPGMAMHGDACAGPEDCVLFIHQHVKGDFIPKQQ
jgi:quercetin dioxygenase-like cupin family protein